MTPRITREIHQKKRSTHYERPKFLSLPLSPPLSSSSRSLSHTRALYVRLAVSPALCFYLRVHSRIVYSKATHVNGARARACTPHCCVRVRCVRIEREKERERERARASFSLSHVNRRETNRNLRQCASAPTDSLARSREPFFVRSSLATAPRVQFRSFPSPVSEQSPPRRASRVERVTPTPFKRQTSFPLLRSANEFSPATFAR